LRHVAGEPLALALQPPLGFLRGLSLVVAEPPRVQQTLAVVRVDLALLPDPRAGEVHAASPPSRSACARGAPRERSPSCARMLATARPRFQRKAPPPLLVGVTNRFERLLIRTQRPAAEAWQYALRMQHARLPYRGQAMNDWMRALADHY